MTNNIAQNSGIFESLDPKVIELIRKFGLKEPTLIQEKAIPIISSGLNALLISQTGTGKTLATFLPIFDLWLKTEPKPISVIYVSPLKSLNRDMVEHLIRWGQKLGIEVDVRHGDTSQHERKMQVEFPPDIMITTLEQLQPMLTGKNLRELLRNIKYVVVDEVHEIVDSKRGVQLSLALERIRELCGDFQLIMLSATVSDPEYVAGFFAGGKPTKVVRADTDKGFEIKVINPKASAEDDEIAQKIFSSEETAARVRVLMDLIKESRSTLTFTNTRDFAEILTSRIKSIDPKFPVEIHHGSLSKEVRIKAEKDFKEEKIKSLICTSSLQLGIDIGSVDMVVQYMSPRQVSQLIQRVGRSGHELSKTSKGVIITTDDDDIFESSVIARKALAGEIEKSTFHDNSYDVLAHQLIGLTFDFGRIETEKAYSIVKRAYPYRNLSRQEFMDVCKQLERLGLVFLDGYIKKRLRGFQYYFENLSTIPNIRQYRVFNMLDRSYVGVLDEEFVAVHGEANTTFIVKGQPWRIVSVEDDKVLVEPVEDIEAAIPGWEGELIPVLDDVTEEVGRLRRLIAGKVEKLPQNETVKEIQKLYPVDENSAKNMIKTIQNQLKFGVIPDDKTILVEDYDDLVVIHSCFGNNVNETLGRFLTALLTSRVGSVGLKTDPYRIMIQFQKKNIDLLKETLLKTNPEHLQSYLEMSLSNSELFAWKFVHVAKRFGAITRDAEFGNVKIKKIIEDYVGTPIYKETLKELETEKFDIEKAVDILKRIQKNEIKLVFRNGLSYIGKIGVQHKYAEVVGPEKPEMEIFELFKQRLLNTQVRMICVNCGDWDRVFTVKDVDDKLKCGKCDSRLLAAMRKEWAVPSKIIKKGFRKSKMTDSDKKMYENMKERADLFMNYRSKAVKTLVGKGIGPTTAKRILGKYHKDEESFLRDILEAEKQFVRTKRFWSL
ncbi:MAG: DEAD/DEAH box helicase [Candidatus Aenigmarchaeota archaeon]|nr:DEAD/DEAH box helicase [Candidatus Aenigmarchaeota archaeon]